MDMPIFNGETLLYYFPFIIMILTLEIIMTSYKSSAFHWTLKLAGCNLIVNFLWITLLVFIAVHPNLLNPEFVPHVASIYNSTTEKITIILNSIMSVILCSVIVTNTIDVYVGFTNVKTKKKSDQI